MNRKGFTLVELLAVITLLSLIMVLMIPAYTEVSDRIKQSNLTSKESLITNTMLEYANSHLLDQLKPFDDDNPRELKYSLKYMVKNGIYYTDERVITNPVTGGELYGCVYLTYDLDKLDVTGRFVKFDDEDSYEAAECI